ncbi:methanogen homoaconitase small subunit [Methanococcus voltae PS]|uniref:Methanogen homoaconitase small subunit n=1 Tax=Methanococcus voltae PS TaxID=523842 RepID=A0ABT2EWV6_METVO|nr:3-isopropylmalate dehydratase small subunit [Methanococcus voltae]MCS3922437.1 methanogen homoaconitase small subunit [Methanococcus voltae PS]
MEKNSTYNKLKSQKIEELYANGLPSKISGKAHIFGDDVDTDAIIPGAYLRTTDLYELALHCMAGIDEDFPNKTANGDVIIAGDNFGCGSSREQAPVAIKYCGIQAIIAESFARIFYRNCINLGIIPIECKGIKKIMDTITNLKKSKNENESQKENSKMDISVEVDFENKKIYINNKDIEEYPIKNEDFTKVTCIFPKGKTMDILSKGGLVGYAKSQ